MCDVVIWVQQIKVYSIDPKVSPLKFLWVIA